MAPGVFAVEGLSGNYGGRITVSVVMTCIVAASGGLIFGYDIGISGSISFPLIRSLDHSLLAQLLATSTIYGSSIIHLWDIHIDTVYI